MPRHIHVDTSSRPRGLSRQVATFSRIIDSVLIMGGLWLLMRANGERWDTIYSLAIAWAVVLFFFFGQAQDLYRSWRGASLRQQVVRIYLAWGSVSLGLLFLAFATKTSGAYSRLIVLSWFFVTPLLLIAWRLATKVLAGHFRERGMNSRTVAIVGARELGANLARTILQSPWMGLRPLGFFDDRSPAGKRPLIQEPLAVIGDLDELVALAAKGRVDLVYITLPLRAEERIKELVARLSDTTASVYVIPDFFLSDLKSATWTNIGDFPAVCVLDTPFYGVDGLVKRIEDFLLASLILAVVALPMAIIAAVLKVTSPGPVIFKQFRYGLCGERIEVWKFRTMTVCENGDDVTQATRADDRITTVGAFLRKTSLDELPQFINVLQGSMSIVGPRPHAVVHNEQYRRLIDGYMLRHKVKPGITGLAQVNGLRGETDTLEKMRQRVEFDLAYIRDWSLWLDIKIILMTAMTSLAGENAY